MRHYRAQLLLIVSLMASGVLWGKTSTLIFTAKCNGSGTADDGASWTIESDGPEKTFDNTKGIHYGSSSDAVGYIYLTTIAIPGEITQVKVNTCGTLLQTSVSVTVGGVKFLCDGYDKHAVGNDPSDFVFTGSASGTVKIAVFQVKAQKPIYCKYVEVTYVDDLVVHGDEEVAIDKTQTVGNLTVENGGQIVLTDKKLTVTEDLVIQTTMGSGSSAQLVGATSSNFEVQGDTYIDITLGDGGNPAKWHAFTVPFPVDATSGIFDTEGNQLTNETHYAIMDYHGDLRADGLYGWKKFSGIMTPGSFYLLTTDGLRTTFRMKKAAGDLVAAANKDFVYYTGSSENSDFGWNGLGNPTCQYVKVAYPVQVLDPDNYVFVTKPANECNFVVGTPFFYQASAAGSMSMLAADAGAFYAPARTSAIERNIPVAFASAGYTDYLYWSVAANASPSYEIGKDLVKMTITEYPSVPQIFGLAYNARLCMVSTPWSNGQAACALLLYAPQAGTYTLSAQETDDMYLYLTYNGDIIAELTEEAYSLSLQKGDNEGYGILMSEEPMQQTPTDVGRVCTEDAKWEKILRNNRLLIRRGETIYDITGRIVTNPSEL